jgi:hypothetical protein
VSNIYPINDDAEPDIVAIMLQQVISMAPGFSSALALQIEQRLRAQYGGLRVRIPKRAKHLTPEQRQAVFQDGLTAMPTTEITTKHKISRATLYREMKKGGRFDPV